MMPRVMGDAPHSAVAHPEAGEVKSTSHGGSLAALAAIIDAEGKEDDALLSASSGVGARSQPSACWVVGAAPRGGERKCGHTVQGAHMEEHMHSSVQVALQQYTNVH